MGKQKHSKIQMRSIPFQMNQVTENKRIDTQYYVEGYATTFEPYVLYRDYEGNDVYELIERSSLDNADMSDIIFQFDHGGMVYARTSNGSLIVEVDEHGLFVAADLGRTEAAKRLYDSIQAGMVTQMSWRYMVDEESYNRDTKTWTTRKVSKIYDVSAVSIPANDQTSIEARAKSLMDEDRVKKENEKKRERLSLLLQIKEAIN
nr:MAG TPA: prohead serine protease [Caudoviricetes sp.]